MITLHHLDTEVDGKCETRLVAFTSEARFVGTVALEFCRKKVINGFPKPGVVTVPLLVAGIRQLFVDPAFCGKGIGTRLLEGACGIAEKNGCQSVNLLLAAENRRLVRFYNNRKFYVCLEYPDGDLALVRHFQIQPDPAIKRALSEFKAVLNADGSVTAVETCDQPGAKPV